MNGKNRTPSQQAQPPIPVFQLITVYTEDGEEFKHTYAKHSVQLNPSGQGGVLVVEETRGDKEVTIYMLTRVKRTVLLPSQLAVVQ